MSSKTVLLCGGPADGRWVTVPNDQRSWNVATLPSAPRVAVVPEPDLSIPVPVVTTYRIFEENFVGRTLWVGVPTEALHGMDWTVVVMKTVLQRDVAQHLGAYR